jgi:hypothetical protein
MINFKWLTRKRTNAQYGFTVLEMSIILIVVGTLLGAYLSFYRPGNIARQTVSTQLKIDRALNALSNFAMINNRLPCPANPTWGENARGRAENASCTGQSYGIIPYRDLGLSQEDAKDGFGFYMTYAMWGPASQSSGSAANKLNPVPSKFCDTALISTLQVNDRGTNIPAYAVIMSHGPEGAGSYNVPASGRYNTSALVSFKNENTNTDSTIHIRDYHPSKNPADPTAYFDDIIGYIRGSDVVTRLSATGCIP